MTITIMTDNESTPLTGAEQAVLAKLKPMQTLLGLTGPIVGILNFCGSIVAGIWLLILGEWGALGAGLAAMIVSSLLMAYVLLPTLPILIMAEKSGNKRLLFLGGFLSMAYTMLVASAWSAWCFHYFGKVTHAVALIPASLWAYEVATTPWVFMASKEKNNPSTLMSTAFIQILAIVLGVGFIFFKFTFATAFLVSAAVLIPAAIYVSSIATDIATLEQR